MLERTWELLRTSLRFIDENEGWLITSRMERQMAGPERMERWNLEDMTRTKENIRQVTLPINLKETLKMETYWKKRKPAERNIPRGMENYRRLETLDAKNKKCERICKGR